MQVEIGIRELGEKPAGQLRDNCNSLRDVIVRNIVVTVEVVRFGWILHVFYLIVKI